MCVFFAVFVRVVLFVCGLLLVPSVKLSAFFARICVSLCRCLFCLRCTVGCCMVCLRVLSLCVWLFVFGMKCLAAVLVSCCVMMCDVVWSVYVWFFVLCVMCCWRVVV